MKKLLPISILLFIPMAFSEIQSYQELVEMVDKDDRTRLTQAQGIVREIDLAKRAVIIGGYSYLVGPSYVENPLQVSLYGTGAGAFELLRIGMVVEVSYLDFGYARIAFVIRELSREALSIDGLAEDILVTKEIAEGASIE